MKIPSLILILPSWICLGALCIPLLAQETEEPQEEDEFFEAWLRGDDLTALDIPPEMDEILPPLSPWDIETGLMVGAGYRDNVRGSAVDPEGGSFLITGIETTFIRLPLEGPRFTFFLLAEHLEFFGKGGLPNDTAVTALSEVNFPFDQGYSLKFGVTASYLDQVIDLATFDSPIDPIRVKGFGLTPKTAIRKEWENDMFTEASASASRYKFKDPLYDHWEYGPKLSGGWAPANSEVSFSLEYLERTHDDRRARSAEGALLPDTDVEFRFLRPQMELQHAWGEDQRWRSSTRLGWVFNRDNETGYYAYDRTRFSQELEFDDQAWRLLGRLSYSVVDYEIQKVDNNGTARELNVWALYFEVQRRLTESLDLHVAYARDSLDSNERGGHDVNIDTWVVGLMCKF